MSMKTKGRGWTRPFIVSAMMGTIVTLSFPLNAEEAPGMSETKTPLAVVSQATVSQATVSQVTAPISEIEQLRRMILDQQRQIDELKDAMSVLAKTDSSPAAHSRGIE